MTEAPLASHEPPKVNLVTEVWGPIKSLRAARNNVLEIIPKVATELPIISGKTAFVRWHMLMHPPAIRRLLSENLENYPKSDVTKNMLEPAIGNSLFIAEGDHWRWQRRAAAPVFTHRNISNLTPIMTAAAEICSNKLNRSGVFDVYDEMVATTFEIISNVTFGQNSTLNSDEIHHAIDKYIDKSMRTSVLDIIGAPTWVPRPGRLFPPAELRRMKQLSDQVITNRRKTGPVDIPDLLDLLMAGSDPNTGREMNNNELRDNILTFIVAGHETTALTLAWALYLCAFDQQVQDKLRTEAQSVLNGRAATATDCDKLEYTEQVINETLRLYPPAAFLSRTAQENDVLCEREIRPKDTVMLPIYALHRHHSLWKNPDQFDPDRFANGYRPDRFAFLPFGGGPRICIGAQFALTEAKIILATLISRFKFERIPNKDPKPVMVLTLRPEGGVPLKVTRV